MNTLYNNQQPFHYVKAPRNSKKISREMKITPGKIYEVFEVDREPGAMCGYGFYITDDSGRSIYCLERGCAILGGDWIICDFEVNLKKVLK